MSQDLTATKIAIFRKKEIRKIIHNNEWWFVITDVVAALTESVQPNGYVKDMRRRDPELSKGWGQIATPLSVETPGGVQKLNCANTEGVFRIIPSPPLGGEGQDEGGHLRNSPHPIPLPVGERGDMRNLR